MNCKGFNMRVLYFNRSQNAVLLPHIGSTAVRVRERMAQINYTGGTI